MPIPALVGAALISGGASIFGSLFGGSSANKQAKMNLQATRETNEMNYKIAQENNANLLEQQQRKMQFDLEQWNRQNEYNSPLAQKQRLEEAGYNPYMQAMSTGNATSSPTMDTYTPQGATMQAPQVDPSAVANAYANPLMAGANQIASMLYQQPMMEQQVNSVNLANQSQAIENMYKDVIIQKQLKLMGADIDGRELQNKYQQMQNDYFSSSQDTQRKMLEADLTMKNLNNNLLQKQLDFLPEQQRLELSKLSAEIASIAATRNLTYQQISNLVEQSYQIKAVTQGQKISNKQQERMTDAIVKNAYFQANLTRNSAIKTGWDAVHSKNNRHADNPYQNSFNGSRKGGYIGGVYRGLRSLTDLSPLKF